MPLAITVIIQTALNSFAESSLPGFTFFMMTFTTKQSSVKIKTEVTGKWFPEREEPRM
jgi:hypothetical protein